MLHCDQCGQEVDSEDAANTQLGDGGMIAVACPDCHGGQLDADGGVEITGGVTCQNCYSVIFGIEKFLRHVTTRDDCTRFTHSDEVVLDVDAHTEPCHSCTAPAPEYEYRSPLTSETVNICGDCLEEIQQTDDEEDSPDGEGDGS